MSRISRAPESLSRSGDATAEPTAGLPPGVSEAPQREQYRLSADTGLSQREQRISDMTTSLGPTIVSFSAALGYLPLIP
jgi:hypothetical protein